MNSVYVQILTTILAAFLAGVVTYIVARLQYNRQKRKDIITTYLIDVWCDLESCANNKNYESEKLEQAIAKIQLLGNHNQVTAAVNYSQQMAKEGSGSLNELLDTLRKELRNELSLDKAETSIILLRIDKD